MNKRVEISIDTQKYAFFKKTGCERVGTVHFGTAFLSFGLHLVFHKKRKWDNFIFVMGEFDLGQFKIELMLLYELGHFELGQLLCHWRLTRYFKYVLGQSDKKILQ